MKEKIKLLSGAQLKYIAFASMLIDHVNKTFFIYFNSKALIVMSELFDILGRIAFPIFISLLDGDIWEHSWYLELYQRFRLICVHLMYFLNQTGIISCLRLRWCWR